MAWFAPGIAVAGVTVPDIQKQVKMALDLPGGDVYNCWLNCGVEQSGSSSGS